ncbi:hypothetical protein [Caenispirillum salinarum]|uniref:hypothetical protein n=1 Tax=Caenispirillum salinarum TaxID=859058 RepID=UPI0005B800FD|nr:hypothetical protein [Caenispirillum salinarum]
MRADSTPVRVVFLTCSQVRCIFAGMTFDRPTPDLRRDLAIALKLAMSPGDRKALGIDRRIDADERARALAHRLVDELVRAGWRFSHD